MRILLTLLVLVMTGCETDHTTSMRLWEMRYAFYPDTASCTIQHGQSSIVIGWDGQPYTCFRNPPWLIISHVGPELPTPKELQITANP